MCTRFNNTHTLVCRSVCSKLVSILKLLAVSHSPQSKTHLRFVDVAADQELAVDSCRLVHREDFIANFRFLVHSNFHVRLLPTIKKQKPVICVFTFDR